MRILDVRHKGLERLMEDDDRSGLPAQYIDKIKNILFFLQEMTVEDELRTISSWRPHMLGGNRKGTWSLVVTRNRRITFRVEDGDIVDLDFIDYH